MLNDKEREFILDIAEGFIGSYTNLKGKVVLDGEDNPEEIMREINICKGLILKLQ